MGPALLQSGTALMYYKEQQELLQNWQLFYYKAGQVVLQGKPGITNWGQILWAIAHYGE